MENLRYRWNLMSSFDRFIAIQVLVFLVISLLGMIGLPLDRWLVLSSSLTTLLFQPWSLITYSFIHADLWHLVFNMLWLYTASRYFLTLFDNARLFTVYFLGVFFAGLTFLFSYSLFLSSSAYLVGSSAGVMAVLIFIATYTPNQPIRIFIFNIKLWQLGAFFVLIDLLQLTSGVNFGGRLAHLVGAGIGYFMGSQLLKGVEIADGLQNYFRQGFRFNFTRKKPSFKVYKNKNRTSTKPLSDQEKIDSILDKISESGYESLSAEEKDYLFRKGQK